MFIGVLSCLAIAISDGQVYRPCVMISAIHIYRPAHVCMPISAAWNKSGGMQALPGKACAPLSWAYSKSSLQRPHWFAAIWSL